MPITSHAVRMTPVVAHLHKPLTLQVPRHPNSRTGGYLQRAQQAGVIGNKVSYPGWGGCWMLTLQEYSLRPRVSLVARKLSEGRAVLVQGGLEPRKGALVLPGSLDLSRGGRERGSHNNWTHNVFFSLCEHREQIQQTLKRCSIFRTALI